MCFSIRGDVEATPGSAYAIDPLIVADTASILGESFRKGLCQVLLKIRRKHIHRLGQTSTLGHGIQRAAQPPP